MIQRPAETFGPYVQSKSAIRQKVRKQIREEGKIKRYSNCFIKYRTEMHSLIVGRYGHQNNKEISRLAGIWWRHESEEVKRIYRQQAQDEKLKHATIYPNYKYTPAKMTSKSESSSALEKGSEKAPAVTEGAQPDSQNSHTSTSTETPEGTEPVEGKEKSKEKPSKKYVVTETPLHAFVGDTEGAEPLKKTLRKPWNESSRRLNLPLDSMVSPVNEFAPLNQGLGDMAPSLVYNNPALQGFDGQVMGFIPQGNVLNFDQLSNGGVVDDTSCFGWANTVYSEQWKTPSMSMASPLDVDLSISQPTIDMASMTTSIPISEHITSARPSSYLAIQTEPQLGHMSVVRLVEVLPQPLPQQVPSTPPIAPSLAYPDQDFPWHFSFVDSSSLMQTHPMMSPVDSRTPGGSMFTSVSRPISIPVLESHLTGHPFNLTMDPTSAPGMPSIVRLDDNVGLSMGKESFVVNLDTSDSTWAQEASCDQHVHNLNNTSIQTSGTPLPSTEPSQVLQEFSFTPIPDEWIVDKTPRVQLKSSNQLTDQQQQKQHQQCDDLYLPSGCNGSLDLCSPQHLQPQREGLPSTTSQRPEGGLPNVGEEELRMRISYLEQLVQQHEMQLHLQQQQRLATQHFPQ